MKISKKIAPLLISGMIAVSLAACTNPATSSSKDSSAAMTEGMMKEGDMKDNTKKESGKKEGEAKVFPKFQGVDFDNNKVDESIFGENEVTLVNFWFNGCSACVNEMPDLEKLNARLLEKDAELIGLNVETGEDDKIIAEAKDILSKQGATYRNISIVGGQEMKDYMSQIFAFPTTIIVDKNGNIIGEPIVGSIEDEKKIENILKIVDEVKAGKSVSTSELVGDEKEDKTAALIAEENKIVLEHQDLWFKVFEHIDKSNAKQLDNTSYSDFLKTQIEAVKDSFTEEEMNTLNEDIKKIAEIDKQIKELEANK